MKIINALAWLAITIAFSVVGLVSWWTFYPYKVLIEHSNVTTTKAQFTVGEDISYLVDITQLTDGVTFTVLRSIEGATMLKHYPPYIYITKRGRLTATVYFPPGLLPTGRYRVVNRIIAHLNPVRDIVIERISNEFEVIEAANLKPLHLDETTGETNRLR